MPFDSEPSVEVTSKDRLIRLRDFISKLDEEHFDMKDWVCGTSACIGGWTARLFLERDNKKYYDTNFVGKLIGLNEGQSENLFFMYSTDRNFYEVNKEVAVKVLDHLIATGEVDREVGFE